MNSAVEMYRGDSYPLVYTICARNNSDPISLTGCSLVMTVSTLKDPESADEVVFSIEGEVLPAIGTVSFTPGTDDTDISPAVYHYDIQMTNALGHIKTIVKDKFTIVQDITK